MKTHTQQQTNLEIETTATEQTHSSRKRSEYRPRKSRGNTLVPVIIALAISAIATIAFLNQGADLSTKNKMVIAQNEIASALSDWVVARTSGSGNPANRDNIFEGSDSTTFSNLATALTAQTSGPGLPSMASGAAYMTYKTDITASCNALKARLPTSLDGVSFRACINSNTPVTGSVDGEFLFFVLD
jgi:hypothetical protein